MPADRRRAPAWLDELRATRDWRLAHTALDSAGHEVKPHFDWAEGKDPSFALFVRSLSERFGERIAVADYSGLRFGGDVAPEPATVTYARLAALVEERAASLRDKGLGPWDHIALALPNSLEVLVLQYAAWSLGAIVSPINPDQRDRVDEILHSADH